MKNNDDEKICFPVINGCRIENKLKIIYCKANGCYTWIYFNNHKPLLITKRIGIVQNTLDDSNFVRCHKSFLVNIHFIKKLCFKTRIIYLTNGVKVKIAFRRLKQIKLILAQKIMVISN